MAQKFWIGGGTTTAWNASPTTNWSATSGGTIRVAAPTVADDVTFDGVGATANSASLLNSTISCLSLTFTSGYTNTITINVGSTALTIAGNFTDNTAHTWVVTGGGRLTMSAASTITSGGKTFPGDVTFSGANTKALSGDWTITGTLTISAATTLTAGTLTIGGLTSNGVSSGTTALALTGGTWTGSSRVTVNMTMSGSITLGASTAYDTGTLTNSSATVNSTGNTMTISASTTFNTAGISWNNISTAIGLTLTLNSLLTVNGILDWAANSALICAGSGGFSVGTLRSLGTANTSTLTLANTVTYLVNTAINISQSRAGSQALITSDHATNKAILILSPSATCNVLASFTRIDASGGRPIWTFNGIVTDCINIYSLTNLTFVTGSAKVIQASGSY